MRWSKNDEFLKEFIFEKVVAPPKMLLCVVKESVLHLLLLTNECRLAVHRRQNAALVQSGRKL
jgi:hypothetical protein